MKICISCSLNFSDEVQAIPIYTYNPFPDLPYINDELKAFEAVGLDGDLAKIH